MIKKSTLKKYILAAIFGLMFAFVFEYLGPGCFFKKTDVEYCRSFISDNNNVREYFGQLEAIKFIRNRGSLSYEWNSKSGHKASGTCHFRIKGNKGNAFVRVGWKRIPDKREVTKIYTREGLFATRAIWPKLQSAPVHYLFPAFVWDGVLSLVIAGLGLLFYISLSKDIELPKLIRLPFLNSKKLKGTMRWIFLIGIFAAVFKAILCFGNISQLF